MTCHRTLRADAARNRELLLAAAAEEFAERGPDASIADIARRAGVGKGTVFRHFPTKDDLLAAIVQDRVADLVAAGERLLHEQDAGAALLEFLDLAARQQQQLDLSYLQKAGHLPPGLAHAQTRLFDLIHALVDRAHEQKAVRPDVTGADVILLMCAPNHVVGYVPNPPPDLWRRYLAIIFDGLRPEGARPLPHPPPDFP